MQGRLCFPLFSLFLLLTLSTTLYARTVTIPIDLTTSGHVIVPVKINNQLMEMMLDSGADNITLDTSVAEKLNLSTLGTGFASGIGGKRLAFKTVGDLVLNFNGLNEQYSTIQLLNLSAISQAYGRQIDGLLGYQFFSNNVVTIDYRHRVLIVSQSSNENSGSDGENIALTLYDNHAFIDAVVKAKSGKTIVNKFGVDTGADHLNLTTLAVQSLGLLHDGSRLVSDGSGGIGSILLVRKVARLASIRVGRYSEPEPVAFVTQAPGSYMDKADIGGIIGIPFLRNFRVTFDYARRRLVLRPYDQQVNPEIFAPSGLRVITEASDYHRFEVVYVVPGSPAYTAGVRAKGLIVSCNGKRAESLSLFSIRYQLDKVDEPVHLTVRRLNKTVRFRFTPAKWF